MVRNDGRSGAGAADMHVRLAEIADEALMRRKIDLLVAEENDAVRDDGVVYFLHLPVGQRLGEVDIADLGADMRRRRRDGDCVVAHERPPSTRDIPRSGLWTGARFRRDVTAAPAALPTGSPKDRPVRGRDRRGQAHGFR